MYHHLEGKLVEKNPLNIVIDVRGIGFQVQVPLSTFSSLGPLGSEVRILTHFIVREDAHLLFGFMIEDERELFRQLLSVTGVGPKVAMTALSGMPLDELKQAIAEGSIPILSSISGIGRKTAERIILELKERMVLDRRTVPLKAGGKPSEGKKAEDAVGALVSLGYTRPGAKKAVDRVMQDGGGASVTVEDLVRTALKYVS